MPSVNTSPTSPLDVAIANVLRGIHRLKKDDKNQHGGYSYVSVDDVKDLVRPMLASEGLHLHMTEMNYELLSVQSKSGSVSSAKITYSMVLRHVSGMATEAEIITIVLPYTGAQTAGAARSYAVKEWLKSSMMVSTGEKDQVIGGADADAYAQQDYTAPVEKTSYRAKQDGDDKEFQRIQTGLHTIEKQGTIEDLAMFWKDPLQQKALKTMKREWHDMLYEQKEELKAKFQAGIDQPFDPKTGEVLDKEDFEAEQ